MLNLSRPFAGIAELTLNRPEQHNAFNDEFIAQFRDQLIQLANDPSLRVLLLRAHGKSFCAGADLAWMQKMVTYSFAENVNDAKNLAELLKQLNNFPVPTIALVQGHAFGGGVGLIACCDIRLSVPTARFAFTEVALGLTPSTIAPYVLAAIGEKAARRYFLTAEPFDAQIAEKINLIDAIVPEEELYERGITVAKQIIKNAPNAVKECKTLIHTIPLLDQKDILNYTAEHIATRRISEEAQQKLTAFLCSKKS